MAELIVTTNKDVEGTKSADTITLLSGSADVESGKGNDIVIDASSGGNEIELGKGDDILKVYVNANLNSENEYEGGKGFDTLMLMLNKSMFDAWSATNLLNDFANRKGNEFDFSKYQNMLGVNLKWEVESFEKLILNRIASATDDSARTDEDNTGIIINVLNNDDDVLQSLQEIKQITALDLTGTKGNVVLNADGTISYNPNGQFESLNLGDIAYDTFKYTLKVTDPNSPSIVSYSTATVTVRIDGRDDNLPPIAVDGSISILEDGVGVLPLSASDPDGDQLVYSIVTNPAHGTVSIDDPNSPNPTVIYTPNQDYNGTDSFTYRVFDGKVYSAPATVSINVASVNDAPVADQNLVFNIDEDNKLIGAAVTATDQDIGDILKYSVSVQPTNGTIVMNENGTFNYEPNANFFGDDKFTFTVTDLAGATSSAEATIRVNSTNDAPVAKDIAIHVNEDGSAVIPFATLGSDVDNDPLAFSTALNNNLANGTISVDQTNLQFVYTPNTNFNGNASFEYQVSDDIAPPVTGKVSIVVDKVNDAPVAQSASFVMDGSKILTAALPYFDVEDAKSALKVFIDGSVVGGSVDLNADGSVKLDANGNFTFRPGPAVDGSTGSALFSGNASFNYHVVDTDGASSGQALVKITVPIYGTNAEDQMYGLPGDNIIYGFDGNDTIYGHGNPVTGGTGNNIIYGGDGNDFIVPQGGTATITGGAGNDTFFISTVVLNNPSDSNFIATNVTITDFDLSRDTLTISGKGLPFTGANLRNVYDQSNNGADLILTNKLTTQIITLQNLYSNNPSLDLFTSPSVQFVSPL